MRSAAPDAAAAGDWPALARRSRLRDDAQAARPRGWPLYTVALSYPLGGNLVPPRGRSSRPPPARAARAGTAEPLVACSQLRAGRRRCASVPVNARLFTPAPAARVGAPATAHAARSSAQQRRPTQAAPAAPACRRADTLRGHTTGAFAAGRGRATRAHAPLVLRALCSRRLTPVRRALPLTRQAWAAGGRPPARLGAAGPVR